MPVQLGMTFESDLVTARTLNRIRGENNERTGKDIVQYVLPAKFKTQAYAEYPGIVRPRQRKYARWKRAKVGHDIPNVLTGKLRDSLKAGRGGVRLTWTANGGRAYIRFYWASAGKMVGGKLVKSGARASQRQEMEAVSDRQRDMLAKRQVERFTAAVNDPANRRKRAIRKARG